MSYPIWWDTNVTVYNKYYDPNTRVITWYRTVLSGCFWKNNFQRLKVGNTEVQTDSIICRIPENVTFLEKQVWDEQSNKGSYFTLAQGDIIVRGIVTDTVDEYTTNGSRSSELVEKYKAQGCMVVDQISINVGPGRGLPHYHIEGV